jgi:hypothetical protein
MGIGQAAPRTCPWCSAAALETATACSSCGAALAQRESIGDVVIPGVTTVDPALQTIDGQPMRIPGSSPMQGIASNFALDALMGGPVGLAIVGGTMATAAVDYAGARRGASGAPESLDDLGRPSAVALQALERLEHEEIGDQPDDKLAGPWRDLPGGS